MAFPPLMPTSFVPRSASLAFRQGAFDLSSIVSIFCYGVFVVALLLAGGVFGYHWYLTGVETAKSVELEEVKAALDTVLTDSFIELHNRLEEGKQHLNSHIAFSSLFNVIESLEPTTVRLNSLGLSKANGSETVLTAAGTATTFNALAALSQILGNDGRLENAIFSSLAISKTGVTFTLTATVDPSLVIFTAESIASTIPTTAPLGSSTPFQP